MWNRTRLITVSVMILALITGTALVDQFSKPVNEASTIAARYHLRTRTTNFFRRAGSGRSLSFGRGLFGR